MLKWSLLCEAAPWLAASDLWARGDFMGEVSGCEKVRVGSLEFSPASPGYVCPRAGVP